MLAANSMISIGPATVGLSVSAVAKTSAMEALTRIAQVTLRRNETSTLESRTPTLRRTASETASMLTIDELITAARAAGAAPIGDTEAASCGSDLKITSARLASSDCRAMLKASLFSGCFREA